MIYHKSVMNPGFKRYFTFQKGALNRRGQTQQGVSLLLALIFVGFFGGILSTMAAFNATEIRQREARVTGAEIVEIGKAARLYVRDLLVTDPTLRATTSVPQRITMAALKAGGYLAPGFGRTVGTNNFTALGQEIHIIMANWSAAGLGGPTNDAATVPSAFVLVRDSLKSDPMLMINAVETARSMGASITAPLFDRNGTNLSVDCRGTGPAISLWDTGCLTQAEFNNLATAIGVPTTFDGGSLIVPAWKMLQFDLRTVMRFPQPDNPGFATMLTDVQMGRPTGDCSVPANQVSITTTDAAGNPISSDTGLCDVVDDTATLNNRFDILNVANLVAERVITEPQTTDFGGEVADIGTANDDGMRIEGDVLLANDLRIYQEAALPAGVTHRFDVPNGTLAIERNTYTYSQNNSRAGIATIGTATANSLVTDQLDSTNFVSTSAGTSTGAPIMNVTSRTTLSNDLSVSGAADAELVTENMSAPTATITASDTTGEVQVTNTLDMQGSAVGVLSIAPIAGYAALFGEINGGLNVAISDNITFLSPDSSVSANSTANYNGTALPRLDTQSCLEGPLVADGCPNRQYFPPNITP